MSDWSGPTERIVTSRGHRYRQRVQYRRNPRTGRPQTRVLAHLGPVDPLYPRAPPPRLERLETVVPSGQLALVEGTARRFHVLEVLERVCPSRDGLTSRQVLALVYNQLNGRKALEEVGPWVDRSALGRWWGLPPEYTSKDTLTGALDTLFSWDEEDGGLRRLTALQDEATRAWRSEIGQRAARFFVYYDVCRLRYYGSHCRWAETGYGPLAPGKPHVGVGLVTARGCHFPVLSVPVKGSLHDSKTWEEVTSGLQGRVHGRLTAIVDRGFLSEDFVVRARATDMEVLGGCPEHTDEEKVALRKWRDEQIERPAQVVPRSTREGVLYFRGWDVRLFGVRGRAVVTLDPRRRSRDRGLRDLWLREAGKGGRLRKEAREELGAVVVSSVGRQGWKVDWKEEGRVRRSDGRFLLFTTDTELSDEEVVEAYFQRDEVEKAFRALQGQTSIKPVQYHKWNRVDAYLSGVNYLAYLIRAGIRWSLKEARLHLSVDDVMDLLHDVYEVSYTQGGQLQRRWGPITKEAGTIIKSLGLRKLIPYD